MVEHQVTTFKWFTDTVGPCPASGAFYYLPARHRVKKIISSSNIQAISIQHRCSYFPNLSPLEFFFVWAGIAAAMTSQISQIDQFNRYNNKGEFFNLSSSDILLMDQKPNSILQSFTMLYNALSGFTKLYNALQCFTMLYNALQCFTMLYKALQCFTMLYNALQCFTKL